MELEVVNFLNTLPSREKLLYVLIRSYQNDVAQLKSTNLPDNYLSSFCNLYESVIKSVIHHNKSVYEDIFSRNENAEPSIPQIKRVPDPDIFADKLGPWASSFSSNSDDDIGADRDDDY